ncbi:hypothetical protein ACE4RU_03200 [Actinobacillus seminis]|uniref:hypothetical protein n=1 Tax=Actinobacillus seminis TaxID=722 RepID=UPI003B92CD50
MNKIFKTKNDVTTGQTKVISELANNRQVASSSGEKPKCGQIAGRFALSFLGLFVMANVAQAAWLYLENGCVGSQLNDNGLNESTIATYEAWNSGISKDKEMILLSSAKNKTGEKTKYTNKDFDYTVVIGSRAVGGQRSNQYRLSGDCGDQ